MGARQLPSSDYLRLKGATRALVRQVGSETQAARLTRVRQQELSNYGSLAPELGERFMPIDVLADLEAEAGPLVTAELAHLAGYELVRLPEVARSHSPLGRITAEALKETADVFARLGEFLSDGTLTAVEGSTLGTEIDEAIVKLLTMKMQVALDARGGGR